jgi:hypothetical protein
MRFYGFCHLWLSSLQKALQAGHAVGDLLVNFEPGSERDEMARHWAKVEKTTILLNGGNCATLKDLYNFFEGLRAEGMPYPFVKFHEDEDSLNFALTTVGIILPEEIYILAKDIKSGIITTYDENDWKVKLALRTNNYEFAN